MDVGYASNMERLLSLLGNSATIRQSLRVFSVSDDQIRRQIRKDYRRFGFAVCPHTATATCTYDQLSEAERTGEDWILVATAHPAKFEAIVEPLIGVTVPVPDALAQLLSRPSRAVTIDPDSASLIKALENHFAA